MQYQARVRLLGFVGHTRTAYPFKLDSTVKVPPVTEAHAVSYQTPVHSFGFVGHVYVYLF